jgi:hypothetical protein
MSEANCQIVSSRGIMKSCDIYSLTPMSSVRQVIGYDFSSLSDGQTVYICSSAIPNFVTVIFPNIRNRFILVTGDCDESCPNELFRSQEEFKRFIESDKIIHWYSQNCIGKHPKLTQIPIGMDYHTMASMDHEWGPKTSPLDQERILFSIKQSAKPLEHRIIKAYANFQFLMNTKYAYDRMDAINKIPKSYVFYEPTKVKRLNTWKTQSEYAFVISPHGNGLDCHRTWEAIALGIIPIVKTSPLDSLFNGLPVWIVKDWSEVNESEMLIKIKEFRDLFDGLNLEKMQLNYWLKKIRNI